METPELLPHLGPRLLGALSLVVSALASAHAVLHKREVRAAIGWTGLIWLVPFGGALLYLLFGINRIARRGTRIHATMHELSPGRPGPIAPDGRPHPAPKIDDALRPIEQLLGRVTGQPLLGGNRIDPLRDGDEAYPAMLEAIHDARSTIGLQTYIFDSDRAGTRFVEALGEAHQRGVEVRVLIDGAGSLYSKPPMHRVLRRIGIRSATFLSTPLPWKMPYMNLRNHRKILVIDGRTGFTGGMNIREGCVHSLRPPRPIRDLHFRVQGPLVAHLAETFARDWMFTTGERLDGEEWFPSLEPVGGVAARGIPDGPDDDFETLHWAYLAGLSRARRRVCIVTPYFLPDRALVSALNVAALSGVRVDVVLPEVNNLRIVSWAMRAQLWEVLSAGCRVWLTPPPFDHSKLMLVDDGWALVGSGNWDPRSYRLNFEFDVECYGSEFVARLEDEVRTRIEAARPLALSEIEGRPLPLKLRDGVAWLFSPYL